MQYKEYPEICNTYVVVHYTGNGVIEDRYVEHEVAYSTNNKKDANRKAKELEQQNNTKSELKSTWLSNTYMVHINSATPEGVKLYNAWSNKFNDKIQYAKDHPEIYDQFERGDMTFYVMKGFVCNEDATLKSLDLSSSGFIMPLNKE